MSKITSNWNDPVGSKFKDTVEKAVLSANEQVEKITEGLPALANDLETCENTLRELISIVERIHI